MQNQDLAMAREIAAKVAAAGVRVYFVGGCVRDWLLNQDVKDIDIEVHGVSVDKLREILDSLGERTEMGASFGVFGLKHIGLDIAMPRKEQSTGLGHKDFAVSVDPFIGTKKAAERRDFTMNALMQDAAQFAARFGFTIAEETRRLSSEMDAAHLAGERVMGELQKALLKAERPSVFFEELRKMNQLSVWFPEAEALIGVLQPAEHHPEGDVWKHTMQVLDETAALRGQAQHPLWLMLAALCHDFGKAAVTAEEKDGKIHAYGHEREGVAVARKFLARITGETKLRGYVLNMVELHMKPNMMAECGSGEKSFMKLYDSSVCPEDLLLLAKADHFGRKKTEADREALAAGYAETEKTLQAMLALYRQRMAEPYLMGRDLVEAGVKPGPGFTEALAYAHKLRLAGLSKEDQLRQTLGYIRQEGKHG